MARNKRIPTKSELIYQKRWIENRWSQQELADRAGLSLRTVSNIESGKGADPVSIEQVAKVLALNYQDVVAVALNGEDQSAVKVPLVLPQPTPVYSPVPFALDIASPADASIVGGDLGPPIVQRHEAPRELIADALASLVVFCTGTGPDGVPRWAYFALRPSKAAAFKAAREKGGCNISEFGTIISMGIGEPYPPEEIRLAMERDYGLDHELEQKWLKACLEAEHATGNAAAEAAPNDGTVGERRVIAADETRYNGYGFRSRTEAHWAVFFDALGVRWEYLPEGLVIDGDDRLPFFGLTLWSGEEVFAAVTGSLIDQHGQRSGDLCRALARGTGLRVLLLVGPPDYKLHHVFAADQEADAFQAGLFVEPGVSPSAESELVMADGYWFAMTVTERATGAIMFPFDEGRAQKAFGRRVVDAVNAARSARFLDGEDGR